MTTAIETEYAGHRFRSRLEARWAVFFDKLGVKWLYEPQGYELGNGERYLPDFWLPTYSVWVEVKGKLTDVDAAKAIAAADVTGLPIDYERGTRLCDVVDANRWHMTESLRRLLILGDVPPPHANGWAHSLLTVASGVVMECSAVLLGSRSDLDLMPVGPWGSPFGMHTRDARGWPCWFTAPIGAVQDAYDAARKARFEHGESGYLTPALRNSWPEPARPAKER